MKHIAAVLLSVLLLSAASCAKPEPEPAVKENNAADVKIEEPAEEIVPEEEVPTAEPGAP